MSNETPRRVVPTASAAVSASFASWSHFGAIAGERVRYVTEGPQGRVRCLAPARGHGHAVRRSPVELQAHGLGRVGGEEWRELADRGLAEVELRRVDRGLRRTSDLLESIKERSELERDEEPAYRLDVPLAHHAVLGLDRQVDRCVQPREVLVQLELVPRVLDRGLQLPLQLLGAPEELFDRAELLHELGRRLLPHAWHPGDVVGGIALQRDVVQVLRRWEPEAFEHGGLVVAADVRDPLHVEHHGDPGADQLEEVAVRGHDHDLDAPLERPQRERGDRVVGLVLLDADHRYPKRLQDLDDQPELLAELVRRLRAARLVLGVLLEANGGRPDVERDRDEVGPLLGE